MTCSIFSCKLCQGKVQDVLDKNEWKSGSQGVCQSRLFLAARLVLSQRAVVIMQPQHIASDDAITVEAQVTSRPFQDFSPADIPRVQSQQHGIDAESVEFSQAGVDGAA